MDNRYRIFLNVLKTGSFTRTAELLEYSQSAISQSIHSLENETGTILLERTSNGITLTKDGEQYLPYIQEIQAAEDAFLEHQQEMQGLVNAKVRIGTFTSVSRNILPILMKEFRQEHPDVSFELIQGEYNSITADILAGRLDFGFVNPAFVNGIETVPLLQDTMMAVLPENHPLARKRSVSLKQLTEDPFIELDEGEYSVAVEAFERNHLKPHICYKVTDDYSILAMVRQSLGISILYRLVLAGYSEGVSVVPIQESLQRTIALAWRNYETMPYAARMFADYIRIKMPQFSSSLSL